MKKLFTIVLMFTLTIFSYAEIKISIYKHMKFNDINTTNLKDNITGVGVLQIQADEEDFGKELEFVFVKKGMMTNRQNIIPVSNFTIDSKELDEKNNRMIIDRKTKHVNFYATLDRRQINKKQIRDEIIEGEYVGAMPIMVSIYAPEPEEESTTDDE